MEKYFKQYDRCRQNEKPFCTHACPFHVDILDFQTKMEKNSDNAAYKTFRNAVGFPDIVAALCSQYCADACPRKDLDQSVQINLLEKTCVARATRKDPTDYNVPIKNRKIAIVGAGISGLACALRLTQKKYDITIFEKEERWGGTLWDTLAPELFLEDFNRQFQFEKYQIHFNTEIHTLQTLLDGEFEAVYLATGAGGNHFGTLDQENGHCQIVNREDGQGMAVFAGGSLIGKDTVKALADGLDMAWAIEVFLKTGRLEYPSAPAACRSVADQDKLIETEAVIPTDDGIYTDEEASAEAARCIRCQCNACMKYCDVCGYHNKWPMRMRDDVMATVAFSTSESMMKKTPAKRLMNTCTQCGLCEEVCPEEIEIGGMFLEARRSLHRQGTMPGAYHQFWLRDMEFTNSEAAALIKRPLASTSIGDGNPASTIAGDGNPGSTIAGDGNPVYEENAYAFFPGCQLGATDPRYVTESYRWLLKKRPDTSLLLRCCGIPAEWAGNEELHENEINTIRKEWEELGKPVLILACPSCKKHFAKYLSEIETISLYEIMEQWHIGNEMEKVMEKGGSSPPDVQPTGEIYAIFDPCAARNIRSMEQSVRTLAQSAGVQIQELPKGDLHGCCGYGGHVSEADREYASYVAKSRCELSDKPYLTYCINCRDIFRGEGKPALHILDLIFGINGKDSTLPSLTQRRKNRVVLKEDLLKEIWGETMEKQPKQWNCKLRIGAEIQEKMDRYKILEEDLCEVIQFGETSKRRIFDEEKGTYSSYRELGHVTCWVEYKEENGEYEIINAYTHRMKIKLEGVWNGRKVEADL